MVCHGILVLVEQYLRRGVHLLHDAALSAECALDTHQLGTATTGDWRPSKDEAVIGAHLVWTQIEERRERGKAD